MNPGDSETPPQVQIQVSIDEETSHGVYTNLVLSNVTPEDVTLDFVFVQPKAAKASVRSRVIMSPRHAKRLCALLQANLSEYEKQFGIISDDPQRPGITLSFN